MNGSSSKNHSKGACNNKKGIDEETEVRALASLYSQTPQYRRSWDWPKSGGIPKTAVLGVIYNLQHPYLGLENGRRYWEGGGMGGRRYWGGTTVNFKYGASLPVTVLCQFTSDRTVLITFRTLHYADNPLHKCVG